jgi:hypothetical protein
MDTSKGAAIADEALLSSIRALLRLYDGSIIRLFYGMNTSKGAAIADEALVGTTAVHFAKLRLSILRPK